MKDFDNDFYDNYKNDYDETPTEETSFDDDSEYEDLFSSSEEVQEAENNYESSYEWNSDSTTRGSGEYHYSYINGNNRNAAHNPNKYEDEYNAYRAARGSNEYNRDDSNPYSSDYYGGYSEDNSRRAERKEKTSRTNN